MKDALYHPTVVHKFESKKRTCKSENFMHLSEHNTKLSPMEERTKSTEIWIACRLSMLKAIKCVVRFQFASAKNLWFVSLNLWVEEEDSEIF